MAELASQYRHDQLRYLVTFEIQLRRRLIHPVLARRAAEDALYDTLPGCGFDIGNRAMVGPNVPGTRPAPAARRRRAGVGRPGPGEIPGLAGAHGRHASHGVVAASWR
jgi:hypothetical protein